MKRPLRSCVKCLALAFLSVACEDGEAGAPFGPSAGIDPAGLGVEAAVPVMTRNVYHGAPLDPLFAPGVTPQQIPFVAAGIWNRIVAADFEGRAEALADEIAASRPVAVGLQEVALFRIQTPGDAALGGTVPATAVALDYLQTLLDALAERGLDYEVAASVRNIDAELPMVDPASPIGLSDIRLTDYDVILVRGDVEWTDPRSGNFATSLPVQLGPVPLLIPRGWASVIVEAGGASFRFFDTHPEAFHAGVRDAQVAEIVALLAGEPLPVILVGDLNAEPHESAYGILAGGGFADAWTPSSDGYTCCHAADLRNAAPDLTKRIDYVLLRGAFPFAAASGIQGAVHAAVVGEKVPDRTGSGLWPSDHAGVVATLRLHPTR